MSDAGIVQPFGGERLNNRAMHIPLRTPPVVEQGADVAFSFEEFAQDVERLVCGKISVCQFDRHGGAYLMAVTEADLPSRKRHAPHNLARQWCLFIYRHHPQARVSMNKIARRFNRDNSTIDSGYKRIFGFVQDWRADQHAESFQEVCDDLNLLGYDHLKLWRVAGHARRPVIQPRKPKRLVSAPTACKDLRTRAEIKASFNERNDKLLDLYYNTDTPLNEIAAKFGIGRKRAVEIIRNYGNGLREVERNEALRAECVRLAKTGLSYDEIGRNLGVTRSAVSGHIFRHRQSEGVEA